MSTKQEVAEGEIVESTLPSNTPAPESAITAPPTYLASQGMIAVMERVMMDPDLPVERIEALLRIRNEQEERAENRAAERAFNQAYARAKARIPVISKDGHVHFEGKDGKPDTSYDHETLAGIAKVVDPILAEEGLAYRFKPGKTGDNRITVTCILSHVDGHAEEYTLDGQLDTSGSKNNFQAVGSTTTYLSRYTLRMALGLSTAQDDDATKAIDKVGQKSIDADQFQRLQELMEAAQADEEKLLQFLKVEDLHTWPVSKLGAAEAMLKQKAAKLEREGKKDAG